MYATQAQLIDRYGERMLIDLTDRGEPATGAADADTVARAIADTDAVIDGYLAGRYVLPLTETPPLLADIAQAIAIYKLHRNTASEKITRDYSDAMRQLRDIAAGSVRLPIAGIEPAGTNAGGVVTADRERAMTPENLRGFI